MKDKMNGIASIASIAGVTIIAAIFIIPLLGCFGNNTDKRTSGTVQANPISETITEGTKDGRAEAQSVTGSGTETVTTKNTVSGGTKITFIELGSVKCIPCKMMQPVMKKIEETYGDNVKVVFYDVWTEKDKARAGEYGINAIPTQVFLDREGNEYYRHQGYFPFEEVEKILREKI